MSTFFKFNFIKNVSKLIFPFENRNVEIFVFLKREVILYETCLHRK